MNHSLWHRRHQTTCYAVFDKEPTLICEINGEIQAYATFVSIYVDEQSFSSLYKQSLARITKKASSTISQPSKVMKYSR